MSALVGPPINRAGDLRSIANSIQPMFPGAADFLRGVAREMDAATPPPPNVPTAEDVAGDEAGEAS